jgi:hypothetical protein
VSTERFLQCDFRVEGALRLDRENGMSYPMTLTNPELWRKIEKFEIDEGVPSLTFAARLARENGWTVEFAERVVGEYKRFVYLAMVAGHRVTPSEHVDQAWHLHMLYTDSYWQRMGAILPRALLHTPTKGGEFEDSKFEDWYAKTKVAYEREFGVMPPRDAWPESEVRFGHDLQWRRVNTADCWVVPKRAGSVAGWMILAFIVIGVVLMMTLLSPAVSFGVKVVVLLVAAAMLIGGLVVVAASSSSSRKPSGRSSGGGWGDGFMWFGGGGCGSSHGDSGSHGDGGGGDGGGGGGCGGGGCGGGGD